MGSEISKESNVIELPNYKKYLISYVKLSNVEQSNEEFKPEIDLTSVFTEIDPKSHKNTINLIYGSIFYKLKMIGYSITPIIPRFLEFEKVPLNVNLENIKDHGFLLSDYQNTLDVNIEIKCYYPTIWNIKKLINSGNILIAGIILDNELINKINSNSNNPNSLNNSDVILIMGYNQTGFIIKTTWINENIELEYKFLDNIREVWNFYIS